MAIFRCFKMAAAAMLDLWNYKVLTVGRIISVELRHHAKFRGDWSNRCRHISILDFSTWRQPQAWIFKILHFNDPSGKEWRTATSSRVMVFTLTMYTDDTQIRGSCRPRSAPVHPVSLSGRSVWLDAVKSLTTEHCEDTNPPMFDQTSAKPTAIRCCSCRIEPRAASDYCPWSGNSYWQRRH